MKTADIRNALKARLAGGSFSPATGIAWPNVDPPDTFPRPYFDTSFTGVQRAGGTLKGDEMLTETGQFNAVIVVDQGAGENDAYAMADTIAGLFPEGLSIPITGASIAIIAPTDIRGGFPTEADYRVPVAIRYHALRD